MPLTNKKKRTQNRLAYKLNKTNITQRAREMYASKSTPVKTATSSYYKRKYEKSRCSRQKKRALSQEYYSAHRDERKATMRNYNSKHENKIKEYKRKHYSSNSELRKAAFSKLLQISQGN